MSNKSPSWFSPYKLGLFRVMAFCVLSFERLWRRVFPFILSLLLIASFAWFGVFKNLSYWPHIFLLWILICSASACAFFIFGFRFPKRQDVDVYLEKQSKLPNQPLTSLSDRPVNSDNAYAEALWLEHKRRMIAKLQNLHVGLPNPALYKRDPYGLRALIILFAVIGFVFSFGSYGGRLADSIDFRIPVKLTTMRVDAWVTLPEYSGIAPIYLNENNSANLDVLVGSIINFRVIDGSNIQLQLIDDQSKTTKLIAPMQDANAQAEKPSEAGGVFFQTSLDTSSQIILSANNIQKQWHFTLIDDKPPTIQFTKAPARILSGSLELNYKLDDDYRITKAYSEITLLDTEDSLTQPLYSAPEVPLLIPRSGKGEARTVQDLSNHPWAGAEVRIRLVAEDGKGQKAYSKSQIMTLPQRIFANPISRALVEQRRILASNALMKNQVLDMLDALMVRPADSYNNMTHFIAFRSARTGLALANNQDNLRASADNLWQMAIDIEGDMVNRAEKRLKQAQAALRDALRNGASAEEIERLMNDLRQATEDYIAALSEKAQNDALAQSQGQQNGNQSTQNLTDSLLQQKLQQLEDLAKTGSRGAAEQLLSELENMMDNLQVQQGQAGQGQSGSGSGQAGNQRNQMQGEIDKLADIMRRQQEALNDTHNLEDQFMRGEQKPQQYQDKLDGLQGKQQQLQEDLNQLKQDLQSQGLNPSQELQNAQEQMQESSDALRDGAGARSTQNQSDALNSMREAAKDLMQQMQEALGKEQNKDSEGSKQSAEGQDPLGRSGEAGEQKTENGMIPEEDAVQAAKRILEELRNRLGQSSTPELEKQYIERLLQFN